MKTGPLIDLVVAELQSTSQMLLKETLILVTVQKKSYKETADILKVPIGTIMSRIHEARRILTEVNNEFNKEKKL